MTFSFRSQLVALVVLIVFGALGVYLYFASNLITRDKLAYVYDLNASLVAARSEEVRSNLRLLTDRLRFVTEHGSAGSRSYGHAELVPPLAVNDADILSVAIWKKVGHEYAIEYRYIDQKSVDLAQLPLRAVAGLHRSNPIPFARVETTGIHLQNNSIPPDVPLLTLAVAHSSAGQARIIVVDLHPQALMRLFKTSTLYATSLIDGHGNVLLHSDPRRMVARENTSESGLVKAAFQSQVGQAVHELEGPQGPTIAAFSHLKGISAVVVAQTPKEVALQAVTQLSVQALVFAAVVMLAALFAAILFSHRIVAPLRRLQSAADEISKGSVGFELRVKGNKEISSLGAAFNRMSERLAAREQRHLSLVGTLGSGVAHELNNPLAAVLANQQFSLDVLAKLQDRLKSEPSLCDELSEVEDALKDTTSAAERMRKIVSDLRNFSKPHDEKTELLDVCSLLDASLRMVHEHTQYRAIVKTDYGSVGMVQANQTRLGQVFVNLLMNAGESIPHGEMESNEIRVIAYQENSAVVVEISDTGAGIAPTDLERIFDPFFGTKDVGAGSGLGLSICHSIVRSMGGTIAARSRVGQGTTIRVALPAVSADATAPPDEPSAGGPGNTGRILVIDDDAAVGRAVGRLLGKPEKITVLSSGREALAHLQTGADYDLVLCDMMMPDVDGIEVYETLEKNRAEITERFVFMTGGTFTKEAQTFVAKVRNTCIEKPFDAEQLRTLVQQRVATVLTREPTLEVSA